MKRTIKDGFTSKEESCTVTVSFTEAEEWRMHFKDGLASKLESSIVMVTLKLKSEENDSHSIC